MGRQINRKGFTLIEVVLVLAIGGLIFLLAFIAFQQVSTNRRDTQRRSDAARVVAELQNYKSDANQFPETPSTPFLSAAASPASPEFEKFVGNYLGGENFKDPQGSRYLWLADDSTFNSATAPGVIFNVTVWPAQYKKGAKCNNGNFVAGSGVAVRLKLETGTICRDDA